MCRQDSKTPRQARGGPTQRPVGRPTEPSLRPHPAGMGTSTGWPCRGNSIQLARTGHGARSHDYGDAHGDYEPRARAHAACPTDTYSGTHSTMGRRPPGRACQGFLVTTPQAAPKGWRAGRTRAPWAGPLLVRDGGGGQLLVIAGQDALPGLQQRDPAAGFQGLCALVDDHHVEVAVGQQLQRAVGRGAWGNRKCEPSPKVLAASHRRDLTERDTTGRLVQSPVWHSECVRGVCLGIHTWEEH